MIQEAGQSLFGDWKTVLQADLWHWCHFLPCLSVHILCESFACEQTLTLNIGVDLCSAELVATDFVLTLPIKHANCLCIFHMLTTID